MEVSSVRVVAHLSVKTEHVAAFETLMTGLYEPTRKEAGCVSYELLQDLAAPTQFTFVEEWASAEALDAHMLTPHVTRALSLAATMVTAPPDIRRCRTLR